MNAQAEVCVPDRRTADKASGWWWWWWVPTEGRELHQRLAPTQQVDDHLLPVCPEARVCTEVTPMYFVSKAGRGHVLVYSFVQPLLSDILSASLCPPVPAGITRPLELMGPREARPCPDLAPHSPAWEKEEQVAFWGHQAPPCPLGRPPGPNRTNVKCLQRGSPSSWPRPEHPGHTATPPHTHSMPGGLMNGSLEVQSLF